MPDTVSGTQVPRFSAAVEALRQCLGIGAKQLISINIRAKHNRSDILIELRNTERSGRLQVTDQAVATLAKLEYIPLIDPQKIMLKPEMDLSLVANLRVVPYERRPGDIVLLLAPREIDLGRLYAMRNLNDARRVPIVIVSPATLRNALLFATQEARTRLAQYGLTESAADISADRTTTGRQGFIMGCCLFLFLYGLLSDPEGALQITHVMASFFFFMCVLLRIFAIPTALHSARKRHKIASHNLGKRYAVLVPLFREAEIIPQLIRCLNALDWPKGDICVLLICEEDDQETIKALQTTRLPEHFQIMKVPFSLPRTKPKALNYALSTVQADYVVIYDAEDRPHPQQLLEAHLRFEKQGAKLGCLQAPLRIGNAEESMICRLFAFEYSALFRGLLPALQKMGSFFPLGGTSNHFRLSALNEVGGWDPYNVTEDADLGLRLHLYGYTLGTLGLPTLEDAPTEYVVWTKQRTRWLKGWMQTWLVLMRHPIASSKAIGLRSFFVAQILFLGLVASAALHLFVLLAYLFVVSLDFANISNDIKLTPLLAFDALNFLLGYLSFFTLGVITAKLDHPQMSIVKVAATLPLYWAMLSIAAWRAIIQLIMRPHYWEKTPHKPVT